SSSTSWCASVCLSCSFFQCSGDHRDLHSFPTRRSSDLKSVMDLILPLILSPLLNLVPNSSHGFMVHCLIPREIRRRSSSMSYFRSEEHTSELQSRENLVCRLLLEKKNKQS